MDGVIRRPDVAELTEEEIKLLTNAIDLIIEIRKKYFFLDPQVFSLFKELEEALSMFDL